MPTFSPKKTPHLESAALKKGKTKPSAPSRRKPPSGGANPKKAPPQAVISKATKIAAANTPEQGEVQTRERITKQERMLTLLSPLGLAFCRYDERGPGAPFRDCRKGADCGWL
jgi:hypothetical protein